MEGSRARFQGIVAAGLIAILTLSVFVNAAYSGPESTIYRLHNGLVTGDQATVRASFLQDPNVPPAPDLIREIVWLLSEGAQLRIARVEHKGREAIVDVVYFRQGSWVYGMRYFLQKPTNTWLVDAPATWQHAVRARMGGG